MLKSIVNAGRPVMKTFFLCIVPIFAGLLAFTDALAADMPPVCYWQLINEERYVFVRADMEKYDWRKIRELRHLYRTAFQETKHLELKFLRASNKNEIHPSIKPNFLDSTVIIMRDPNGAISNLPGLSNEKHHVEIPKDKNLIGRYLLGAHLPLGNCDVDGDTIFESVHLYAKHLVVHRKNGGTLGRASVVFFDDARQMPLEIGPAINTAKSRFGGGTQQPHRAYEMQVKYLNKPMPGVEVMVINMASQWEKRFVTDDRGKFEIIPPDHRSGKQDWQKYLYVATHHDRKTNAYYVATFPTYVYKNQPEWLSKTLGFTYWAIISSFVITLMILGFISRKKRQERQMLTVFENYKTQRGRP